MKALHPTYYIGWKETKKSPIMYLRLTSDNLEDAYRTAWAMFGPEGYIGAIFFTDEFHSKPTPIGGDDP